MLRTLALRPFLNHIFVAELCVSTEIFSKTAATLGNVEENDTLSHALARLAEVEEKVEALHEEQVGEGLHMQTGCF